MFGAGRLASVAARASQRLTIAAPGVGLAVGTAGCYTLLKTSPAAGAPHCEARTTMAMTPAASSVHFASGAVAQKAQEEQFSNFELASSPSTPTPPASTPTPVVVPKAKVEAPEAVENSTHLISDRNVALEAVKKDGHALARRCAAIGPWCCRQAERPGSAVCRPGVAGGPRVRAGGRPREWLGHSVRLHRAPGGCRVVQGRRHVAHWRLLSPPAGEARVVSKKAPLAGSMEQCRWKTQGPCKALALRPPQLHSFEGSLLTASPTLPRRLCA